MGETAEKDVRSLTKALGGGCHRDLAWSAVGRAAHPTSQMTVTGTDLEEGWENSSKTGRPWGFYMHKLGPIWLTKLWKS